MLTYPHIITCFEMCCLDNLARSIQDTSFQRLQEIGIYHYEKYTENPELIDDFMNLCTNLSTFLPSWNDTKITPTKIRLYSHWVRARESLKKC